MQNVFIINGCVAIVFEYNKSRAANNHLFYIVRYLPNALRRAVYQYLVYIQLFIDFLYRQLSLAHLCSTLEFLF